MKSCFKKIFFSFLFIFSCQASLFCSKRWTLDVPTQMPTCVTWWKNMLCVGSMDGSVDLFKVQLSRDNTVAGWKKVGSIKSDGNITIELASNNTMLVVASRDVERDQTIIKTYTKKNRDLTVKVKHSMKMISLDLSEDGKYLVAAFSCGHMFVVDLQTKKKKLINLCLNGICSFALNPRCSHLAQIVVGRPYGFANIFNCDLEKGMITPLPITLEISEKNSRYTVLKWEKNTLIAGSDKGVIKICSNSLSLQKNKDDIFHSLSLRDDGILASSTFDGSIDLWDVSRFFKK